jgi:hypothetical protein
MPPKGKRFKPKEMTVPKCNKIRQIQSSERDTRGEEEGKGELRANLPVDSKFS